MRHRWAERGDTLTVSELGLFSRRRDLKATATACTEDRRVARLRAPPPELGQAGATVDAHAAQAFLKHFGLDGERARPLLVAHACSLGAEACVVVRRRLD